MAATLQGSIPAPRPKPSDVPQGVKLAPNARFLLRFHPQRWQVSGGKLVPILGKFKSQRGVNGVSGRGDETVAAAESSRGGWVLIPEDIEGEEDPSGTYLRTYPCANGGTYWATKWEKLYVGTSQLGSHTEDYCAFLGRLRESGAIPAPLPHVLDAMLDRVEQRIEEAQDKAAHSPSFLGKLDELKTQRDAIVSEIVGTEVAPKQPAAGTAPKPRKPRKPAARKQAPSPLGAAE